MGGGAGGRHRELKCAASLGAPSALWAPSLPMTTHRGNSPLGKAGPGKAPACLPPNAPFLDKAYSVWVALKSQATQQPGPALTREEPRPAPGSQPSPALPAQACVHVCTHAKALSQGPQVSLPLCPFHRLPPTSPAEPGSGAEPQRPQPCGWWVPAARRCGGSSPAYLGRGGVGQGALLFYRIKHLPPEGT